MVDCEKEIVGIKKIALYINKNVQFNRPNPSIENEIDLIAHAQGSFVIDQVLEFPKWQRVLDYSENYKIRYVDIFSFQLNGIENNVPDILRNMRNNRLGYVTEIVTTANNSYVFPTPVFYNERNTKQINNHSWNVSLSYRVPTFEDRLYKLNTVLMIYNYLLGGDNSVLAGSGDSIVIG